MWPGLENLSGGRRRSANLRRLIVLLGCWQHVCRVVIQARSSSAFAFCRIALELHLIQRGKYPAACDQVGKRPLLGDLTVLQDQDGISPAHRREPVRNDERGTTLHERLKA